MRGFGLMTLALVLCSCGHQVRSPRAQVEDNYRTELLALAGGPADDADRARLERKYMMIRAAVEADEASPLVYHPLELQAVQQVVSAYGNLYIGPSPLRPDGTYGADEVMLETLPWSGYWYPLSGTDLFATPDAPFVKLDRLLAARGRQAGAAEWERQQQANIPSTGWEGFCAAWAVASTRYREPTRALTLSGVTFTIADQKALLTKAHEQFATKRMGVRYDGDVDSDGTYQDLRPEAFHRLAVRMIAEEKRALVVDDDPGVSVWTKPLYRLRWSVRPDPARNDAFLVSAYPWFVSHRSRETDRPTSDLDVLAVVYEYRLYVDRQSVSGGQYLVVAGEWLNGSRRTHPDYASVPAADGAWGSANPSFNASLDLVRELFERGAPR